MRKKKKNTLDAATTQCSNNNNTILITIMNNNSRTIRTARVGTARVARDDGYDGAQKKENRNEKKKIKINQI